MAPAAPRAVTGPLPGTPEFRSKVKSAMAARGHDDVTGAEADAIAEEALLKARRKPVMNPLKFMLTAISEEDDPWRRWLSHRQPAARTGERRRLPWCGKCDPVDRSREDGQGRVYHCPDGVTCPPSQRRHDQRWVRA